MRRATSSLSSQVETGSQNAYCLCTIKGAWDCEKRLRHSQNRNFLSNIVHALRIRRKVFTTPLPPPPIHYLPHPLLSTATVPRLDSHPLSSLMSPRTTTIASNEPLASPIPCPPSPPESLSLSTILPFSLPNLSVFPRSYPSNLSNQAAAGRCWHPEKQWRLGRHYWNLEFP